MISNFNFIKKNKSEIFKQHCSEITSNIERLQSNINEVRYCLYNCDGLQLKPIAESSFIEDCKVLNRLIKNNFFNEQKREVFVQTLNVIEAQKKQNMQIDQKILHQIKNECKFFLRNSLNHKIYENLMLKQQQLNNYFNSIDKLDSPTKIRSDVFKF